MKKNQVMVMVIASILLSQLSGCSSTQEQAVIDQSDHQKAVSTTSYTPSSSDLLTEWDESATLITLAQDATIIEGEGVDVQDNVITITKGGDYVISGTLSNGQLIIAAEDTDKVHVILKDAQVENQTGAAIYAKSADKVIITLAEGSKNSLKDGGEAFAYQDEANEEPDAALFAKCDLTLNGEGSLEIQAGFNNGIGTKDDLVMMSGTYQISALNHAIRGKDSVVIMDGYYNLIAGNDGIQTSNSTDSDLGWMILEDGEFIIQAAHDGIQSESTLLIEGGSYQITTGGGYDFVGGDTSQSYKAVKSVGTMDLTDGNFVIDSQEDAIHTNADLTIHSGIFTIQSGDDAIHSDSSLLIEGGTIDIPHSYEGIEAAFITIQDGVIDIIAQDDGINAASAEETESEAPRMGGGSQSVVIEGGTITISTNCDGIDSNGTLSISGGTVISLIDTREGGSGGIDCDGDFTATGGTIIYGGTSTGNTPSSSSTQSYVYLASSINANSLVSVMKDGETLISFTPNIDITTISLSSPKIVADETYDLYVGDVLIESVVAGVGGGINMGRGDKMQQGAMFDDSNRNMEKDRPLDKPTEPINN